MGKAWENEKELCKKQDKQDTFPIIPSNSKWEREEDHLEESLVELFYCR